MTDTRRRRTGLIATLVARTQLWVWCAVLMSVLVCSVISGLYAYQRWTLERSVAALDAVRQARIDLAEGFLHLILADGQGTPFERGQGLALLNQALASFEATAGELDQSEPVADALERAVATFRARLQEWGSAASPGSQSAVRLRIALQAVITEADRTDASIRGELRGLAGFQDSVFLVAIVGAALLLGAICGVIFYAGQSKEASEGERRQAEEALREAAQTLTAVMDSSPMATISLDARGKLILWSREAERIFGYSHAEMAENLFRVVLPDRREESRARLARALAGEVQRNVEARYLRKDGSPVDVQFSCAPLHDRNGVPSGVVYVTSDITERKAMETQLLHAQKMEAVGNLAGGIAHDFNNTLGVIVGNLDMLLSTLPEDSEAAAMAGTALQAAQRGTGLTGALLAFARRQPLSPRLVDVNELVRGMSAMLRRSLGEQVNVQIKPKADLWQVRADPGQLQAALLNLTLNARDAMPDGGVLTIETANVVLDQDYAAAQVEVTPGEYVMLAVSDTGSGMSPDVLARVFEPFFTTKPSGKGTGLGLSMVFGFVKQSGGHIKAYSEPGHGCTMKLYLPRAAAEAQDRPQAAPAAPLPGGDETVLLVEDNPDMLRTVAGQLEMLGYRPISADSAAAALTVLESGQPVDLLFTDIVMPGGMSGIELIQEARMRRPALKVLATSGFHQGALQSGKKLPAEIPVLSKPYRLADLAQSLRAALDQPAAGA